MTHKCYGKGGRHHHGSQSYDQNAATRGRTDHFGNVSPDVTVTFAS